MQNNEQYESIWADGCPERIAPEDRIKPEELHMMAVDYICKLLIKLGCKLEQGFPRRQQPNVVCKKDDITYAIIVLPSVIKGGIQFTDDSYINLNIPNEARIQYVQMCKQNNAIPLIGPVAYWSIDKERSQAGLMLKGDVFSTICPGFVLLNDEEEQNLNIKKSELFTSF